LWISCELSNQARKKEEANDLVTEHFLTSNANELLDYYSVLEEIKYNRIAKWLQTDGSNAKEHEKNPVNWEFSK
jgi:hypothetical protein